MGYPIRRLLIVLALLLAVWPAALADQGIPLKRAVEDAEVVRALPLGGASVGEIATGEDCIVIGLQQNDSSTVAAFTHSGDLLFWYSVPSPGRPKLLISDVSEDGSTIVLSEDVAEYVWRRFAIDRHGKEICELPIGSRVQVSPSGRYFCPIPNDIDEPAFKIYDRTSAVIDYSGPGHHHWNASFLSDSIVVFADPFHVRLVETQSGDILSTTRISLTEGFHKRTGIPSIIVSRMDSVFVVHNGQLAYVFSFDGDPIHSGGCCNGVVPSAQGEWLALRCDIIADSAGYFFVTRTRTPQDDVRSERIPLVRAWYPCLDFDISWFSNGVISTWSVSGWDYWRDHELRRPYQTLFIEFHPETITLDSAFAVPGLFRPIHGDNVPKDTYLRIVPPDTIQLVRFHRE